MSDYFRFRYEQSQLSDKNSIGKYLYDDITTTIINHNHSVNVSLPC